MNEQRFLSACQMRQEGKLKEAIDEFVSLAETTEDRIDRAGILWSAATTAMALRDFDVARQQLKQVRMLVPTLDGSSPSDPDDRTLSLLIGVVTDEADLSYVDGNKEEALAKLNHLLERHPETFQNSSFRDAYHNVQVLRACLLADLGNWREALPILEEAQSWEARTELIGFYLGHCYLAAHDYERACDKLTRALSLALPNNLEYRARCELGMAYYKLEDYAKAKRELEKGAEKADASYIKKSQIWKWLELTCMSLGLKDEAQHYASLSRPS